MYLDFIDRWFVNNERSFIKNDSLMRYEVVEDNKGCSHELKFR